MASPSRVGALGMLAMLALAACAAGPDATTLAMEPGAVVVLRPGQVARLPDATRLEYVGLRADSRCPPGVVCVHAGWAEVDVRVRGADGATSPAVLSTRAGIPAVVASGWRFELVEIGRGPSPPARLRASPWGDRHPVR